MPPPPPPPAALIAADEWCEELHNNASGDEFGE